jgi:protein-L-isoaspartate(D-aspartate) O-methyltransferase
VVTGPLTHGWPVRASYDVIFLNGAMEILPAGLASQLKDGGRLVAIVGQPPTTRAVLYRAVAGNVSGWPVFDAGAALLPGFAEPPAFVF